MNIRILLVIGTLIFFLCGCGFVTLKANGDTKYVLRLGHMQGTEHPYHVGALEFKKIVEKNSDGQIQVDLFPSSQLGNSRDLIEGLQFGSVHFYIGSVAPVTNFSEKFNVLSLPYIFDNREHAFAVLDGEIGEELTTELEKNGLIHLAFMENGWRHLTNNKHPIKTADDTSNLKIRVQESPPYIAFINALGSTPVPIPFGELYTALEQKVIDGQENPLAQISLNKLNEVQSYLTLTAHTYDASIFLMSQKVYDKIPSELQEVIRSAAKEAAKVERDLAKREEQKYLNILKESGMQIEENPDIKSFKEVAERVYKEFDEPVLQQLIKRIRETNY